MSDDNRAPELPKDIIDKTLSGLMGLPNGAHTQPAVTQVVDFYGNVTNYTVQTVRWDEGNTVFVTQVNAAGHERFMLPPKVLAVIGRQADTISSILRRRQGRRLAETRQGQPPAFTAASRAKALATRRAKAARRKERARKKRGGA